MSSFPNACIGNDSLSHYLLLFCNAREPLIKSWLRSYCPKVSATASPKSAYCWWKSC